MPGLKWLVDRSGAGLRLDKWLADPARLGSRSRAADAIGRGRVFIGDVEQGAADGSRTLVEGDVVRVWADRPGTASRRAPSRRDRLAVLYEDDRILVANKPAGLLTVPLADRPGEQTLRGLVAARWRSHGGREPHVVHRIDRDTSGLVVFAKDRAACHALKDQFVRREPRRIYLAVVEGAPESARGSWRDWLRWNPRALCQVPVVPGSTRALEAVAAYEVIEAFPAASLLQVSLTTGRQHQIRVQAWLHGVPLVGERTYRDAGAASAIDFPRQALHAAALAFRHPITGRLVEVEAPLADDLRRLLVALRRRTRG